MMIYLFDLYSLFHLASEIILEHLYMVRNLPIQKLPIYILPIRKIKFFPDVKMMQHIVGQESQQGFEYIVLVRHMVSLSLLLEIALSLILKYKYELALIRN